MKRRVISAVVGAVVVVLIVWGMGRVRAQDQPIDVERARALFQRVQKGETLGPEDRAYLERAKKEIRKRKGAGAGQQIAQPVPVPAPTNSTGLVPLCDLGTQTYKGEDGGLYGGGRNEPPPAHRAAVESELKQIRPLDAEGRPADGGKIVFLSIGMSNTTQEFSAFKRHADADPRKSPTVVIVDGAQGGRVASVWANDAGGNRGPDPWPVLDQRLKAAGASPRQVQVAWIKHAQNAPHTLAQFPRMMHAQYLAANIMLTLQRLRQRFPNLRVAYLSSRIYAGYATTPLNPEPYAYEGAFANRWVILAQAKGDPLLNFDPARGTVLAPAVLWGPYLWADGVKPRGGDGLTWLREDLSAQDGTHPSTSGREKVARLLLDFVHTNPLASSWYLRAASGSAP
jgi:hypothetical protein